jgi:hypothetical protein
MAAIPVPRATQSRLVRGPDWDPEYFSKAVDALKPLRPERLRRRLQAGPRAGARQQQGSSARRIRAASSKAISTPRSPACGCVAISASATSRPSRPPRAMPSSAASRPLWSPTASTDNTLPALNVVLEPTDKFLVRFGAAKVMSRPDLANLTPGATVSVSGSGRSVTVGNPNLDPFRADTYDLSVEWYPQRGALMSVALFSKKIDTFVQTICRPSRRSRTTPSACPTAWPSPPAAPCRAAARRLLDLLDADQQPRRRPDRLRAELPADPDLPAGPAAEHWGAAQLHLRQVDHRLPQRRRRGGGHGRLTNLSRNAYNATLYYEDTASRPASRPPTATPTSAASRDRRPAPTPTATTRR